MDVHTAINLIQQGVIPQKAIWADLGAGTGLFTVALDFLLKKGSTIYAVDKSPHGLYKLETLTNSQLQIVDGDFTRSLDLPLLDGILMANAIHYVKDKKGTLSNLLKYLKPNGAFILLEYDTEKPTPIWVPHPISFEQFRTLSKEVGLSKPKLIGETPSAYGHQRIYSCLSYQK